MMSAPLSLALHARWSGLLALVVMLGACGEAHVVQREPDYATPMHATTTTRHAGVGEVDVVRGDTLYGLAFRHSMDFRELAAINGIESPYTIYVGQILKLRGEHPRVPTAVKPVAQLQPHPVHVVTPSTHTPVTHSAHAGPQPAVSGPAPASIGLQSVPTPFEPIEVVPSVSQPSVSQSSASAQPAPMPPALVRPTPMPSPSAQQGPAQATSTKSDHVQPVPAQQVPAQPIATQPVVTQPVPAQAVATPPAPMFHAMPAPVVVRTPSAAILPADVATVGGVHWRWPAKGTLLDRFMAGDATRQGIDIGGNAGDQVLAASDGTVVYSGSGLVGYGELIIIKHSDEWLSAYGHNRKRLAQEGQRVKAGQPIAEMGSSGANRDELHFEIRRNGKPVDPLQYLPGR